MLAWIRASLMAALLIVSTLAVSTLAVSHPHRRCRRQALPPRRSRRCGRSASKREIKANAGTVGKPLAALRRDADAALARNDVRAGMQVLGQIVTVAPADSANWLRLARAILQTPLRQRPTNAPRCSSAPRPPPTSPTSAAATAAKRPTRWSCSGALTRNARCGARRSMRCGSRSNCARSPTSAPSTSRCATITASGCSTMRSISTARRRARASSSPRSCRANAPISRRSWRLPARTSRRCRSTRSSFASKGLQHGERYAITLRAGLPSTVKETLPSRPISPSSCATAARSCALPARPMCCRAPASAASRWSASTPAAVAIKVYRIGDRNLLDTVVGDEFPAQPRPLRTRAARQRARLAVWNGELKVESPLNAEVTTAFPVDEAIGALSPGVYVMSAEAAGAKIRRLRRPRHPMVHRVRSRADRVLRQRRHPRVRQFAGERDGECAEPKFA